MKSPKVVLQQSRVLGQNGLIFEKKNITFSSFYKHMFNVNKAWFNG